MSLDNETNYAFILKLSYRGTDYWGWQTQGINQTTVQGIIIEIINKITNQGLLKSLGSSRTDRGVHALEQYCKIILNKDIELDQFFKSLNSMLPNTIKASSIERCSCTFKLHASVKWKEYRYYFAIPRESLNQDSRLIESSVFINDFIYFHHKKIDIEKIKKAIKLVEGEKDFCNYFVQGTKVLSTIRTIYFADVIEENHFFWTQQSLMENYDYYYIIFQGSGFLKQMVRLLVGALFFVAEGKMSEEDFKNSFNGIKSKKRLSFVFPANGLFLAKTSFATFPSILGPSQLV